MPKVVANSTPLIALYTIDKLVLLEKLYGKIYIPDAVYDEVTKDEAKAGAKTIAESNFIEVIPIKNIEAGRFFKTSLHAGEVEAMILYGELDAELCIIDDYLARKYAKYLNIKVTGTLGLLLKAKEKQLIDSVKPLIDKLMENDFYVSDELYQMILNIAHEN